jgi:hypothetical protein
MLRAVLPEGNTPLSEAGRASVQDPVILTLIRVRFLLALGILYLMIAKLDLVTSLFILLGASGPDLRRNGVDGTPCVASLTRIRQPAVFSSDARTAFWQLVNCRADRRQLGTNRKCW